MVGLQPTIWWLPAHRVALVSRATPCAKVVAGLQPALRHGMDYVAPSGLDYGSVRYRGLRSQGSLHPRLFCVTASRFFVVAIDGNLSGSLFPFCIYTGSVALRAPLEPQAVGLVAFSAKVVAGLQPALRHGMDYVAPSGLDYGSVRYRGLRSFHELRPVLGCGALTGLFYWMAAAHRVSFACGDLHPVLGCGALTGLF